MDFINMKKILLPALFSVLSITLWAVPASPNPFQITQPDGSTLMVKLVGDEYHAYYTTEDGIPLRRAENGFLVEDFSIVEQSKHIATARRNAAIRPKENAKGFPLTGQPKSLVLLVGFKDQPFTETQENFDKLLNESGYAYNGATGSCRDYFIDASDSVFQPHFDVFGPFALDRNVAYYGGEEGNSHDRDPYQMIADACQVAAENGVNFADYDLDNDNVLDNVFVYYAGHNQAEGADANTIWPHQSNISWKGIRIDGKLLATYACTSEYSGSTGKRRASIGTFCHEFGHVLGLPDLYDTGYKYYTVSTWSIMCSGSYNNRGNTPPTYSSYERFFLGWLQPQQLETQGQYTLSPLQTSNQAFLIAAEKHNLIGDMPSPNEFFMLEYRPREGWDLYNPGEGMLVWHIDYSASAWANNTPNNGPNIMRIHLEEANGIYWNQRTNGEGGKASDPYPGSQNVTTFIPKLHDGTILSDQNIFEISNNGEWISFIYQSLGNVKLTADKSEVILTTTVSDSKKIVDWTPQSINVSAQELNMDTITFSTKGNFYVAVAEEAPARSSKEWKKVIEYKVGDSSIDSLKVWISFVPTKQNCDEIKNTLSINTLGASTSIALIGYAPRPTYITTPQVMPITNVSPYSFRASWKPVEDAVLYYVTLFQMTDGESSFTQDFEDFNDPDAVLDAGWQSNVNRTTTSAKADGTKALSMKNTGEYVISEEYLVPVKRVSFWVNAFASTITEVGYVNLEAWNGDAWISKADWSTQILATTKKKYLTFNFDEADNYTKFRITYVDNGGNGVALDAFEAVCTKNISLLLHGKDLAIDAFDTDVECTYEFTELSPNTTYYFGLRSTDITKGCEEHISPMSPLLEVMTKAASDNSGKNENILPIAIDATNYEVPTPVVYLSEPHAGDLLNIYNVTGALVYSYAVQEGVSEYVIPTDKLQKHCIYFIKHIVNGKMKRKQGWAKFIY